MFRHLVQGLLMGLVAPQQEPLELQRASQPVLVEPVLRVQQAVGPLVDQPMADASGRPS